MGVQLEADRYKFLSGSVLKLIACISMLIDHLTKHYLYRIPGIRMEWFTLFGRSFSPLQLLLKLGRFAFPIFVFLLVEGFFHTKNRKKYGQSLFILALLSEIPFNLMTHNSLVSPVQNVMFTLLLGYLAMCSLEYFHNKPIIGCVSIIGLLLISILLNADYQARGFLFILAIYGLRKERIIQCLVSPFLLNMKAMVCLSLLLTCLYNGKRGFIKTPFLKYCFYAFYPVHMLIVYLISCYCH